MNQPQSTPLLLGSHVSIAGGMHKAFARAEQIGCTAIQLFTKNANRWQASPLTEQTIRDFRQARRQSSIRFVAAHDSYLINLANPQAEKRLRSEQAFLDELERCAALGIEYLVMHPGAHLGGGIDQGLQLLTESLRAIGRDAPQGVRILLENTAGQGSCLGARFEELAEIMDRVPEGAFGVCLDTCHAFAAGYDLSTGENYQASMAEFDRLIGLEQLVLIHANDSKKPLGSRVDRHQHIGQGEIGREGFHALMADPRLRHIPRIIETPNGPEHCFDLENLALLRQLAETALSDASEGRV